MNNLDRRSFVKQGMLLGMTAFLPFSCYSGERKKDLPFKMSINPWAIGAAFDQRQLLEVASKNGFTAIVPLLSDLSKMEDLDAFLADMKAKGMSWDAANLPVEFRQDQNKFDADLAELANKAALMKRVGATGCNTWIMPTNDQLTYLENFKQHTTRLKAVAQVLAQHGIKLGLEYVGPKTLMARDRHPFISSLQEILELLEAIDEDNVGVQLDSFHWFCAGETAEDIKSLSPEKIITCDLNDAVEGRTADEQLDWERELPSATGVIDLKSFLSALNEIGYKGPIRAEPFNKALNELDDLEAVKSTYDHLKRSFEMVNG